MTFTPTRPNKAAAPTGKRIKPRRMVGTGKVRVNINIPARVVQMAQENFPGAPTPARAVELWLEMMATPETEG